MVQGLNVRFVPRQPKGNADVRALNYLLASPFKIHRYHLLSYFAPDSNDLLMFRMNHICVQGLQITINGYQAGIERPVEVQNVRTDQKALDVRDQRRQSTKRSDMRGPLVIGRTRLVFPANNVCDHNFIKY